MQRKVFTLLLLILLWNITLVAQNNLLQSGPMVGYSTMKEVLLWVQTTQKAKVKFVYYEKENTKNRFETEEVETKSHNAFVAKIIAKTKHSTKYKYELYINGKLVKRPYPLEFQSQVLWHWRQYPDRKPYTPVPNFSFAFGSCNYVSEPDIDRPGKSYGGDYEIFKSIYKKKPDFMLWGGDNIYLREADWNSRTGILYRYTYNRSSKFIQPLLANCHHYATWDDHDFGPNNSDYTFWQKENALDIFKLFWGNPNYGVGGGISGVFQWNDAEFFVLDDRYFRTQKNIVSGTPRMFGEKQLNWLLDAINNSHATFKFIVNGSQVLNTNNASWGENLCGYPEEQKKLLEGLKKMKTKGVIFLTGDRHHTEISRKDNFLAYPLYDITISPLTAGAAGERGRNEGNTYRVKGTYYGKRNFAMMNISGPFKNRVLTINVYDTYGKQVYEYKINANDLKKK